MRQTLEALCKHAGSGSRVYSLPLVPTAAAMKIAGALRLAPLAPYHALMYGRSLYFDVSRTKAELGWQPRWSNEEMVCQSYDWYLAHKDLVLRWSGESPHRSAVKQGILRWLKRLS
jgi:nucleoside-diphosphate-sugar epimerase